MEPIILGCIIFAAIALLHWCKYKITRYNTRNDYNSMEHYNIDPNRYD